MSAGKARLKARQGKAGDGRKKVDDLSDLINHRLVAEKMGVRPNEIREWVKQGSFPRPHSIVQQTWFYRVADFRAYLATGKWPEGMRYHRSRGEVGE